VALGAGSWTWWQSSKVNSIGIGQGSVENDEHLKPDQENRHLANIKSNKACLVTALTYTTALVVIPPQETWAAIQAIRQQYDRKVRRWMPHITLIYPFHPVEDFAALREPLSEAIVSLPAFDVTLAEFQTFRHRRQNYTVWLKPEPQEPLAELHEVLSNASLRQQSSSRGRRFQPHLSVGQVQGRNDMERLVAELQTAWKPITFRVDCVSLIWRRDPPDDVFRVAEAIPLLDDLSECKAPR
jgi:2'-5' RNA ligase